MNTHLQFYGSALQPFHLLVPVVGSASGATQFAYSLSCAPQLRVVGVVGKASFVGAGQQMVVNASGIANAQHADAALHQFACYPVDGHIALCAHHHLAFTRQRFVDGLYQRCGLACARRAVQHHHIFSAEHACHGLFLRCVEPRQPRWCEGEVLQLHLRRVEHVAQISQAVATGPDGAVEGFKHQSVAGFVEAYLHAHAHSLLQQSALRHVGHLHGHAVGASPAHGARHG